MALVNNPLSALYFADGEFDAVVFSGLLCPVTNVPTALAESDRVLRAGGEVRFYEHVRSKDPWFRNTVASTFRLPCSRRSPWGDALR